MIRDDPKDAFTKTTGGATVTADAEVVVKVRGEIDIEVRAAEVDTDLTKGSATTTSSV